MAKKMMNAAGAYIQAGAKGALKVGVGIVAQKAGGELVRGLGGQAVANLEASQPQVMPVVVNIGGGLLMVGVGSMVANRFIKRGTVSKGDIGLMVTGVMAGAALESAAVENLIDRASDAITGLVPGGLSEMVAGSFVPAGVGAYGAPAQLVPGGMSTEVAMGYPGGRALPRLM